MFPLKLIILLCTSYMGLMAHATDHYYHSFGFVTSVFIHGKQCQSYYVRYKDYEDRPYALIQVVHPFDWGEFGQVVERFDRSEEGRTTALQELYLVCKEQQTSI